MNRIIRYLLSLATAVVLSLSSLSAQGRSASSFAAGNGTFLLDGEPFVIKSAELHYPRIPREYWEHRIEMCRALGMNTVCLCVFWNIHEQREGEFDFTGQNDVAAFCRLAQKHGMYVIVRPGPYICAEWEMGGLPWWLLKKKDIRLREQDEYFMERVRLFEEQVGEQLADLTVQRGGPIIMVQVENEYGSYGEDKAYVGAIRDCLRSVWGDEVTLFQCDWASNFTKNGLDDLLWTMNFGTGANIDKQFERLRQLRPESPLMCSEFWSGWFDKWGARHETRPAEKMVAGIDEMLSKGISFSLYMTHGGTSFGHWAGANSPGYAPDVTSYDYDAPINEYGAATPKYHELRALLQRYSDRPLPAVPRAPAPLIAVPEFELTEFAPLTAGIRHERESRTLLTMEDLDMGWGSVLYETTLPDVPRPSMLTLAEAHDYAQVFVDDVYVGSVDRVRKETSVALPPVRRGQTLRILVEATGRINFGRAIKDYKGITERVTIATEQDGHALTYDLHGWRIMGIEDSYESAVQALATAPQERAAGEATKSRYGAEGYYRGHFTLRRTGDTFLNLEAFGKGQVYVNGYAVGRFWNIGPQQTLYVPGCWLRRGRNEVVVLDVVGPAGRPTCFGQDHPELDKLNRTDRSADAARLARLAEVNAALTPAHCVAEAVLAPAAGWQTVATDRRARGRYLALECRSTHDGAPVALAELYVQTDGQRQSREPWTLHYATSADATRNRTGDKVFDLQESTYWQAADATMPQVLVIDLGAETDVTAVELLPRAEAGAPGFVRDVKIYVY